MSPTFNKSLPIQHFEWYSSSSSKRFLYVLGLHRLGRHNIILSIKSYNGHGAQCEHNVSAAGKA